MIEIICRSQTTGYEIVVGRCKSKREALNDIVTVTQTPLYLTKNALFAVAILWNGYWVFARRA